MSKLDAVFDELRTLDPLLVSIVDADDAWFRDEVEARGGPDEAAWIVRRVGGG
jgi:hypothetical protein